MVKILNVKIVIKNFISPKVGSKQEGTVQNFARWLVYLKILNSLKKNVLYVEKIF